MPDIRDELMGALSDPDPVRRAQIQMLKPLPKRFYTSVSMVLPKTAARRAARRPHSPDAGKAAIDRADGKRR